MSLAVACGWSLVRSLAVALAAWPVCRWECAWLAGLGDRRRRLAWIVLVIPFLCPELWTGYAWSGFSLRLAGADFWRLLPAGLFPSPQSIIARDAAVDELLLDLLLFFRAVPVGTLALYFSPPPPLSAEAVYCRDLALGLRNRRAVLGWLAFALRSRWHAALPAAALMFLVSFQEFELASLIGRPAWTVWLFDAQAGGLALCESLQRALVPVCCQVALLAPAAVWALSTRALPSARDRRSAETSPRLTAAVWCLAFLAVTVTVVVPVVFVGKGTWDGLASLAGHSRRFQTQLKEILTGTGYALTGAVASAFGAAWLLGAARLSRLARAAVVAFALPGLFGPLVMSLALIGLLQQPYVHVFYKTPALLAASLTLFLFPRALALRLMLWSSRPATGSYLATLLRDSPSAARRAASRELVWQLRWRGEFWSVALLTYWGFLDLTIAYLLAPVTIVSTPVMLYNQMHFGKNAVLSALVFLTVLIPALLFLFAAAARSILFFCVDLLVTGSKRYKPGPG